MRSSFAAPGRRLGALLVLVAAAACARLPDDPLPPSGPATDSGPDVEPGGAEVMVDAPVSETAPLEVPADGPPPASVCQAGNRLRCEGNALITCNEAGTGPNIPIPCQFGCNTFRVECNVCQPDQRACNGITFDTCKSDGSGWFRGGCSQSCLPVGGCCTDLDCGRCNMVNPCRRCSSSNRCEDNPGEPACSTQGPCTAEATEVCRQHGATCEVRRRIDSPCRYQLCRWASINQEASCGPPSTNRGIWTIACHPYSYNNPGSVPLEADGACITMVENITMAPYTCL